MAQVCVLSGFTKYLHAGRLAWSSTLVSRTTFSRCSLLVSPTSCKCCTSLFLHNHQLKTPLCLPSRICFSSSPPPITDISNTKEFTLIYRFPGIKYCRAISRIKLLQTALTVLFLPPMYYYYFQGQVTGFCVAYSSGIALFAGVMLYCLSFYLRRIIGMMYLNAAGTTLKVSHLTFWGRRRDMYIAADDVKVLSESGDHIREVVRQFKRYSIPDTMYFSLHFGVVVDKEKFMRLFGNLK
ncbi:transmembrane protein 186 isoform X2 [Xenopus laevis]|nr:transmembrane protein 186 isoform X2 [Xenopus laevis]XP_018091766.1 transmembrane protein 186 isoform X2 [Xenopus laevis]